MALPSISGQEATQLVQQFGLSRTFIPGGTGQGLFEAFSLENLKASGATAASGIPQLIGNLKGLTSALKSGSLTEDQQRFAEAAFRQGTAIIQPFVTARELEAKGQLTSGLKQDLLGKVNLRGLEQTIQEARDFVGIVPTPKDQIGQTIPGGETADRTIGGTPIPGFIDPDEERRRLLPPEPPPIEDVVGQQPGAPVAPPADTGQPLPEPGQVGVAPTTPGQAGALGPQVEQDPRRTTIAVPDPRNPGQLIEIPVVDRGIPGDIETQTSQFLLEREGLRQQEQQRRAFEAQRNLRGQRLGETRSLLEDIAGTQFQERQAGLLEELQTGGLLQTSELEQAFARESGRLTKGVQQAISGQALQDRQAEISGIGDILARRQAFQTAGLQREFSLEDFERAAQVARETGAAVTPQVGGSQSVQTIGAIGGAAAGIGGLLTGIGGLTGGEGTYICTKLKQLGLMTDEEINKVHTKIFTGKFNYYFDWLMYGIFAPRFIKKMEKQNFNWQWLKEKVCDDVLACETAKEAFELYRDICVTLFSENFTLCRLIYKINPFYTEVNIYG